MTQEQLDHLNWVESQQQINKKQDGVLSKMMFRRAVFGSSSRRCIRRLLGGGGDSYNDPDPSPLTPQELAQLSRDVDHALKRVEAYWAKPEAREPVKFYVVETEGEKHELLGYEGESVREVITRARAKVNGFPFDQCCRAEAQSPQKYPTHLGPNCTACHVYVRDEDLAKMEQPTKQEEWQLNYVLPELFKTK
jgi:hypothetical protein